MGWTREREKEARRIKLTRHLYTMHSRCQGWVDALDVRSTDGGGG